jgi:hypothetical protein
MGEIFIIGNGPSATNHKLGKIIDAADVVVRLNDFKTKGLEDYVGHKTDILFTCRLNEYIDTIHQFPEVILSLLMNPLEGVTVPDHVIKSPNISRVIDWPEVHALTEHLAMREDCYPSTGFLCILNMISRFGRVNIIGFDFFANGNEHYYETGPRAIPTRHDGTRERVIVTFLNKLGLLTFAPDSPKFYHQ